MSGNVKLSCPSGGSVTVSAADTASNVTATIPAATDTLVNLTSTQTLTNKTMTAAGGNAVEATAGPTSTQLAGQRNLIINGSFPVWQRGTSFTSSAVNEYSADRFRTEGYNTSTTISQQTFSAGQTDVPGAPQYYCRVQVTGTPGGAYWSFQQRVEAPLNIGYGAATYTLSFYAKAVSGTIAANTFTYGLDASRTGNPSLTTSWQRLTTTITGYYPSGSYAAAYLVYITNSVSSLAVDIANVQLEKGATATPFENLSLIHI